MPLYFSNLAPAQLSTLIVCPPLGLGGEIGRGRGRVPIQTLFCCLFTSQESGEVNKQLLVFNCGPFIALPWSVLESFIHLVLVHLPIIPVQFLPLPFVLKLIHYLHNILSSNLSLSCPFLFYADMN